MKESNVMSDRNENDSNNAASEQDLDLSNSNSASPNLTLLEARQNPGEILKLTREKMGLQISDISSKTKINENQVLAIENGALDRLPPATFAKAFIKSYCRVLSLDPEPVLLGFGFEGAGAASVDKDVSQRSSVASSEEPKMPSNSRRLSSLSFEKRSSSKRAGLLIGLAAVVLFAVVYLPEFFSSGEDTGAETVAVTDAPEPAFQGAQEEEASSVEPLQPVEPESSLVTPDGLVQETLPLPIDGGDAQGDGNSVFPAIREEQERIQGADGSSAESESSSQADQAVAADTAPPLVVKEGNSSLRFVFSNESWVTVRDATNAVLLSQLNPGGSSVQVQGVPPFKLIVGKASQVTLYKDGQSVDLEPHIRGEVARLTLE